MKPPFLTSAQNCLIVHRYSKRTIDAYLYWIRLFALFSSKQRPAYLGGSDIKRFYILELDACVVTFQLGWIGVIHPSTAGYLSEQGSLQNCLDKISPFSLIFTRRRNGTPLS
ncbi:phage integrase N-terminal SAM-like domain-containing protein [Pokkaliibacter plantistimulans]